MAVKRLRSAVELNVEDAYGVRSHAMLEGLSADRQRFARHRLVDFRFAPTLLHFVQIERAERDGFVCQEEDEVETTKAKAKAAVAGMNRGMCVLPERFCVSCFRLSDPIEL